MSYTQLFFNKITATATTTKLTLQPNFNCPKCGAKNQKPIAITSSYQASKVYNYSALVTFKMPCCGIVVSLFFAVHKEINGAVATCIQKSSVEGAKGIIANWWVNIT